MGRSKAEEVWTCLWQEQPGLCLLLPLQAGSFDGGLELCAQTLASGQAT